MQVLLLLLVGVQGKGQGSRGKWSKPASQHQDLQAHLSQTLEGLGWQAGR